MELRATVMVDEEGEEVGGDRTDEQIVIGCMGGWEQGRFPTVAMAWEPKTMHRGSNSGDT